MGRRPVTASWNQYLRKRTSAEGSEKQIKMNDYNQDLYVPRERIPGKKSCSVHTGAEKKRKLL